MELKHSDIVNILEKRLTISRSIPKNGHWKALEPKELESWINNIKDCEKALGTLTIKPTKVDLKETEVHNVLFGGTLLNSIQLELFLKSYGE